VSGAAIVVRSARSEEVDALVASYEWLFAPPGSVPAGWEPSFAADTLRELAAADDADVLVATDAGAVVGLCTVYRDIRSARFGQRAWVEDLAVDPQRRSQGIGGRLLGAAKAWARARGCTHLELDSSTARTDAHRFYEREEPSWRSLSYGWDLTP